MSGTARALTAVARRAASGALLLVGASVLLFALVDLAPGDPVLARFGFQAAGLSDEDLARLRHEYGLDRSLPQRYVDFVRDLSAGDLGTSARSGQPIGDLVAQAFPVTASLTLVAAAVTAVLALGLGITAAVYRGRWPDRLITAASAVGLAAPVFWVGLLAIDTFAIDLRWLPAGGYQPVSAGLWPWLSTLLLPAVTLALGVAGILVRVVRASVADQLDQDYVRTALGAGLSRTRVLWRNLLPNALVTPLTVFGLYVGYLLAGAVLVEVVYALPGMGQLLVNAAIDGDFAVTRIVALVTIAVFLAVNLCTDVVAMLIDPRTRT
ncbi:ABC transporter permease [Polymorphospora lycopeni]|uniref:ABC transporter permease n=1 Tax=Polymorphospora lycopeni TaxID=3140240 RepID=A0ABV5D179_9ACTN